jgi:HK97 family phage portal protein
VAPGTITVEEAKNLRALWEEQYGGENSGRVGVLGNGLKYEPMAINAVDSQLIDQLKWTAENVCTAFGVPPYMIGVAPPPTYTNIEALTVQYYTQCLQTHIESIELLLDEGLGLTGGASPQRGTEFDLDQLMRMDTASRTKAASEALGSGAMAPNEARQRYFELPPVTGGDTPYLQQQNYSLAALHQRDQSADPFSKGQPSPAAAPSQPPPPPSASAKRFEDYLRKECA